MPLLTEREYDCIAVRCSAASESIRLAIHYAAGDAIVVRRLQRALSDVESAYDRARTMLKAASETVIL